MASLTMSIPHQLSQQEALTRTKGLLDNVKQEKQDMVSNLKEEWQNETGKFSFTVKGFDLAGTIKVLPGSIELDATVPFAVALFKGKIKDLIGQKAKELLA